jgi:hypothetical protein
MRRNRWKERLVNALRKGKIAALPAALTGTAGALLLAAIVTPSDPLGRSIGALLAVSLAVGLAGLLVKGPAYRSASIGRGPRPGPVPVADPLLPIAAPVAVARLTGVEAIVWDGDAPLPDFAPVVSLTEARTARRRTERAPREAAEA